MTDQKELFEMADVKEPKEKKSPGDKKVNSSRTLPEYFAPLEKIDFSDLIPLGRYASTQYLQYAIATVKDRALPRIADGQKTCSVQNPLCDVGNAGFGWDAEKKISPRRW